MSGDGGTISEDRGPDRRRENQGGDERNGMGCQKVPMNGKHGVVVSRESQLEKNEEKLSAASWEKNSKKAKRSGDVPCNWTAHATEEENG